MKKAFTIIELLVVIAIIAILMGVLLSSFSGSTESARAAKCEANMHNLAMAVQSVGMSSGYYPRASTMTYEDDDGKTRTAHGWLTDLDNPYETASETRRTCFDNGAIWSTMKHDRSCFACPSHQKYAKEHSKAAPLWSYAMNSYFNVGATKSKQRQYGSLRRADRFLLLAEVPYAQVKISGVEIQSEGSGSALDPVLDRDSETIGFNHKDGRNYMGHVCFADGHVEKFRAPTDKGNAKELTGWLCNPIVNRGNSGSDDFDIRFNGTQYTKDQTQAE